MANKKNVVDVVISDKSISSAESLTKAFGQTAAGVNQLIAALDTVEQRLKAIKATQVLNSRFTRDKYVAGATQASSMAVKNTAAGGDARSLALYNKLLKADKEREIIALATGKGLEDQRKTLRKITDIQTLNTGVRAAEYRLGEALSNQKVKEINAARAILAAFEKRRDFIQNEIALYAKSRKEAEAEEKVRAAAAAKLAAAAANYEKMRQRADAANVVFDQAAAKREAARHELRMQNIRREVEAANNKAEAVRNQPQTEVANAARSRRLSELRVMGDGGASLLKIQAQLAANFMLLNGARTALTQAVSFSIELDNSLRNLQAITETTDQNMGSLKETITEVAMATKFSATEIAAGATILGQAGMSVQQIEAAIGSVALLATATGTTFDQAVDTATATLDVFNLEAGQMGHVADVLTSAINESKLNIDKLTLGLQYAGNTAAQSGVTFEELTAALGAMSNAGIRSGSTLGTGMRQILISLEKPSKEFRETLSSLGLTMNDVDVASQGIYGALKNLKDAGFSASDAMQSFEIRGAAAFTALSGNLDDMLRMEQGFLNSTAAARANEIQMRSFKNTADNFKSTFQSVVEVGLNPFILALRDALAAGTRMLSNFQEYPNVLMGVTASAVALGSAFTLLIPVRLLTYLVKIPALLTGLQGTMLALAIVAPRLTSVLMGVGTAIRFLAGPVGLVVTAIGLGITAWYAYNREAERVHRSIETLRTEFDNAAGEMTEYADKIKMVDGELETLNARYETLKKNSRLLETEIDKVRNEFAEMGFDITKSTTTVDELIEQLRLLKTQLGQEYVLAIDTAQAKNALVQAAEQRSLAGSQLDVGGVSSSFKSILQPMVGNPLTPSNEIQSIFTKLGNPNLKPYEAKQYRNEFSVLRDRNEAARAGDPKALASYNNNGTGANTPNDVALYLDLERNAIDQLGPIVESIFNSVINIADAKAKEIEYKQDKRTGVQQLTQKYQSIDQGAMDLGRKSTSDLGSAILSVAPDDISGQGKAAQSVVDANKKVFQDLRNQVLRNVNMGKGSFDPVVVDQLLQAIDEQERSLIEKAMGYIEAGKEEDASLLQQKMERLSVELSDAQAVLSDEGTNSPSEISKAIFKVRDLMFQNYLAELQQIKDDQSTSAAQKAGLQAAATGALSANLTELNTTQGQKTNDFRTTNAQNALDSANIRIAQLNSMLEGAGGPSVVDEIEKDLLEALKKKSEAEQALALLTTEEGVARENRLTEIADELLRSTVDVGQASTGRKDEIVKTKVAEFEAQIAVARSNAAAEDGILTRQLAEAEKVQNPTLVKEITAKRVALQANLIEVLKGLVGQIEALGVTFKEGKLTDLVEALKDGIFEAQEAGDKITGDIEAAGRATEIDVLEANIQNYDNLISNAQALADGAKTLKERNTYLEKIAQLLQSKLKAGLALIGLKNFGADPAITKAQSTAFTSEMQGDIVANTVETASTFESPDGGGGGGKQESELEKFTSQMEARLATYEALLKAKLIDGSEGLTGIGALVDQIKAKITEVDGQIAGMQGAIDGGQMSEEDLEKLNELLKSRETLTEAARAAEFRLTEEMIAQGDYWGAAKQTMTAWAENNLTMVAAFAQGLEGTLSSLVSGFATLFTDLANGTKTTKDAFRDFAIGVIKSLQQMIGQMMAVWVMQKLIGAVAGPGQAPGSFGAVMRSVTGLDAMTGGVVRKAGGGMVEGNLARDSKLHNLMPGEYVLRKSAVDMIGVDALNKMNSMGNRAMAGGGHVGVAKQEKGPLGNTNVYVVSPDQQPVPGPQDIIAIINDDIARGGSTKRLIKTVSMGY